jgi:hypothetical protein
MRKCEIVDGSCTGCGRTEMEIGEKFVSKLTIYYFENRFGIRKGSLNKDKINKMRGANKLQECHISDFNGHLMGGEYL